MPATGDWACASWLQQHSVSIFFWDTQKINYILYTTRIKNTMEAGNKAHNGKRAAKSVDHAPRETWQKKIRKKKTCVPGNAPWWISELSTQQQVTTNVQMDDFQNWMFKSKLRKIFASKNASEWIFESTDSHMSCKPRIIYSIDKRYYRSGLMVYYVKQSCYSN